MLGVVAERFEVEQLGDDDEKLELVDVDVDDGGFGPEVAREVGGCGNEEWEEKGRERAVW